MIDRYKLITQEQVARPIASSAIKFSVDETLLQYTVERDYWLIKIDVRDEDCFALVQEWNELRIKYFPELRSAIAYSFDLILSAKSTELDLLDKF